MATDDSASIDFEKSDGGTVRLVLRGRLDVGDVSARWRRVVQKVGKARPSRLEIDADGLESCDAAGMALLQELRGRQEEHGGEFAISGLSEDLADLMQLFDVGSPGERRRGRGMVGGIVSGVGEATSRVLSNIYSDISFGGEVFWKFFGFFIHPGRFRWRDMLVVAEKTGADAVGITALMGFLIGLILAFQGSIAMGKFGAEVYVADLVTISLFRELGPLITAFILASRSGSAFAAELGTMKVNEEIDALTTMGIDPVRFLVFPRLVAAVLVIPLLTMFNNLFGLLGCGVVMVSLRFAPAMVVNQIYGAADLTDLTGGLVKTLVFGALIAGIGCLKGLRTGGGASAVGDSATRAVVSGIVAIVVTDGVFAVVYYFLGI